VIRPLRERHRRVTTALAVLLPVAYGAAVLAREPERTWELPPAAAPAAPELAGRGRVIAPGGDAWGGLPLEARFGRGPDGGGVIELTPVRPLRRPDLLVYWTPVEAAGELPSAAVLLGPMGEVRRSWSLPHDGGCLTLFDLAHGELVASQPLPAEREE